MKLSIIIVNWNTGSLLRKCLDALSDACRSGAEKIDYEVFVVDNASIDNSISEAQKSIQPFSLKKLQVNEGFAKGNNMAIKETSGDIVLLLNPDTQASPGSLVKLTNFFSDQPKAGIVGGKLLNADGSLQPSVRSFPTLSVLVLMITKLARVLPNLSLLRKYEMKDFSYQAAEKVDQVMGACFAIKREVIDKIGLLDEKYWIWFEEVDFCKRAIISGFETWYTPEAEIIHHQATSFSKVTPLWRAWQFSRSALRYAKKHLGALRLGIVLLITPIGLLSAFPATLLGSKPGVKK